MIFRYLTGLLLVISLQLGCEKKAEIDLAMNTDKLIYECIAARHKANDLTVTTIEESSYLTNHIRQIKNVNTQYFSENFCNAFSQYSNALVLREEAINEWINQYPKPTAHDINTFKRELQRLTHMIHKKWLILIHLANEDGALPYLDSLEVNPIREEEIIITLQ
jgi:hypothetical protein